MDQVVISLLAPACDEDPECWIEQQVDRLRNEALARGVRLGPLERSTPSRGGDWLIAVDRVLHDDMPLEKDITLAGVVTALGWLGLRPHLLVISEPLPPAVGWPYVAHDVA
jgi:hypothetical protein